MPRWLQEVDRVIAGNDEDIKSVFKWYFSEAVSTKGWPPPDVFYLWYYMCTMDVEVQVDVEVLVEKMGISVRRCQPKVGRLLIFYRRTLIAHATVVTRGGPCYCRK